MHLSAEVIFPVAVRNDDQPCVFPYNVGPTALKIAKRRGRPKSSTKRLASIGNDQHLAEKRSKQNGFEFVHITGASGIPDLDSRKVIRRRVMINHFHHNRKKKDQKRPSIVNTPCAQIAGVDPFNTFPVIIEPYMHDLLTYYITVGWQRYYSVEKYTTFNPMAEYWLPRAMVDDAFFHILLGCANSHFSPDESNQPDYKYLVTIKHLNAAIAIVNKRIQSNEVPTATTLVVISTIAMIEKNRGSHENWKIHMKGLHKLVTLHGGLEALEAQPLAMGKIHRADLVGSIDAVQTPYFSNNTLLSTSKTHIQTINIGFKMLHEISPFDTTLISCIQTAAEIIASLKKLGKTAGYTEAASVRYWTTALQYNLLSTAYSNPIHEICRLAILLFSELLVNQSCSNSSPYEVLISKITAIYKSTETGCTDFSNPSILPPQLRLWSFCLAAYGTGTKMTIDNCRSIAAGAASELGLSTDEEVRSVLKQFLWDSSSEINAAPFSFQTKMEGL
ncbi:hypothetical protein N7493_006917 [Penicillium malachiteum]|uniref:Uncharacterized protein n=1 Tax=Penicillium malachiteum TaxID=1324776 RepID=A0AAD6MV61_9EURO|nr:hypothetical protein N7493_006917 [Penicillium malachiteum]